MKKFLSLFLSITMLFSITTTVNLSAYAGGWSDYSKEIQFGTTYTNILSTSDYRDNDGNYYNSYKFYVPYNRKVTVTLQSETRAAIYQNYLIVDESFEYDDEHFDTYYLSDIKYNSAIGLYTYSITVPLKQGTYYYCFYGRNNTDLDFYTIKLTFSPKNTTLSSVTSTVNGFKVNWSKVSDTTGYQIQYSTRSDLKGAATVYGGATNATSKTITGRAAGTKYYVRVRTYITFADGSRVWGNWTSAKAVTTKVKTANAKSVSGVTKGFKVTWDKIGGITGYQVQYATRSDFKNAATVYAGNANATSKTITGRARNTKYYVRVRAYKNNNGSYVYGAWSSAKNVKTK